MVSQLLTLKDIGRADAPAQFLDLKDGKVYQDAEGAHLLYAMDPTEFVLGEGGKPIRNPESDTMIHRNDLAMMAAKHYYAGVADQYGVPVDFKERDPGNTPQSFTAQPGPFQSGPRPLFDKDGHLVAMDLAVADVHQNATLPTYAAGYKIAEGIADLMSPVVLVPHASNLYATWNKEVDFQRKIPNQSSAGRGLPEVNPGLAFSTYTTQLYTLAGVVPTEIQANADAPLQVMPKLMQMIVDGLKLEREIRVATQMQTSGSWGSALVTTVPAGQQWNGGASADPLTLLRSAIRQSFMPVTAIAMSEIGWHDFTSSPAIQKYFYPKDSVKAIPSPQDFTDLFGLPPIYVGTMKYMGAAGAITYVWGKHVVLIRQPSRTPPMTQMDIASNYTFRWIGGGAPDGSLTSGFLVRTFFDPKRGPRGATMVVCVHNDSEQQTSGFVGGLLLNTNQ